MRFITIISLTLLSLGTLNAQVPGKPSSKNSDTSSSSLAFDSLQVDSSVSMEIPNAVALNYKEATNLLGKAGKDTATYITTIKPGKRTYCSLFRAKSGTFSLLTSSPEGDKMIESIVNGEPHAAYTDSKYLFLATDQNFKALDEIDRSGESIGQRRYIVVLTNKRPNKLIRASKKK